ncbi:MAG: insulinase family protein [Candidatus Latescibacteria bacterium]|nr:insulinase family protein [Candidatus Latescibacterota bacterium]
MTLVEEAQLGEQVFSQTLPGGLELFLLPKPGFRSIHALLAVGYGSIDRCFVHRGGGQVEVPDGVAHFLEHRLFSSSLGDVGDRFAALGAEINAHTTFTNTVFFFTCTDRLEECLELLLDFVFTPSFSAEGVVREREIIARELQLYGDNLEWVSFFSALQTLYGNHPLGVDIAGTCQSLQRIDERVLELCHRTFYRPDNMVLFIGGDLDIADTGGKVRALMAGRGGVPAPVLLRQAEGKTGGGSKKTALPIALSRLCLGFRDQRVGLRGEPLLRRELALEVLLDILFGAASDFYARHYESGLIDAESFGCEIYAEPEFCFCLVGGDTPDPVHLQEAILEELRRARQGQIIGRDFPRAARRAYGQTLQRLDLVEGGVGTLHSSISRGGGPFGLFSAHRQLAPQDLYECLDTCLVPDHAGCSTVLPVGTQE